MARFTVWGLVHRDRLQQLHLPGKLEGTGGDGVGVLQTHLPRPPELLVIGDDCLHDCLIEC